MGVGKGAQNGINPKAEEAVKASREEDIYYLS